MTGIVEMAARVQQLQALLLPAGAGGAGQGAAGSATDSSNDANQTFANALTQAQGSQGLDGSGDALLAATGGEAAAPAGPDVVADARRYLGVPYVWGGTDPSTGLDCSGFIQRVYADLGYPLPRVSTDQARAGQPVANLAAARPGDVLAFGSPVHHVGIYLGNGQMIDAPKPGDHVKIERVWAKPAAIRRIIADPVTGPDQARPPGSTLLRAAALNQPLAGTGALNVPYGALFGNAAAKYGLPASLLAAVAKVESGYDPSAVSPAGAQGLMQLMPGTAAGLGANAFDPAQAVDAAAKLLAGHLRDFGSLPLALAAYNAGPGAVRRYGGIPPYAETRSYVNKVQSAMAAMSAAVGA